MSINTLTRWRLYVVTGANRAEVPFALLHLRAGEYGEEKYEMTREQAGQLRDALTRTLRLTIILPGGSGLRKDPASGHDGQTPGDHIGTES